MFEGKAPDGQAASSLRVPTRGSAIKIAALYAVVGAVWILCSSGLLHRLVQDRDLLTVIETFKGWVYVGVTALVLGVALDRYFAEIRRSALRLLASEAKLRMMSDNLPAGYVYQYHHDAEGRPHFTYISAGVERVHGVTPAEVIRDANCLQSQIDPSQIADLLAGERESARLKRDFEMEFTMSPPGRGRRSIYVHSHPRVAEDGLVHWDGFAMDVTEQRQAQRELKENQRLLQTVIDLVPHFIFAKDRASRHLMANRACAEANGMRPDQMVGLCDLDFVPDKAQAEGFMREDREVIDGGRRMDIAEQSLTDSQGRTRILEAIKIPFQFPGAGPGLVGVAVDITERKRLESQLRQAQKLDAIGQLAGGIAHDFNNMLAAILMQLGMVQMNPSLNEEALQALREVESEARRAAMLTRQLLMLSRRSVLAIKPMDINEVVANLLRMLTRLIDETISLRFEGASGLPAVEADAGMIEQVLMNLVVNARDAMPKGGVLSISTFARSFGEEETVSNPNRAAGAHVCLSVSDTGCGMDEATLKRIFEPFFTTKEAGKGTGLGLATVHGIVAQHKGWVEVGSAVGKGTCFTVYLPATDRPVARSPHAEPARALPRGRDTILLVEDEHMVRRVAAQALKGLGYRVHEAANGQEAMQLWEAHREDVGLLFTDMVMPEGMTGLELVERLRTQKPTLKAVVSSGYSPEIVQGGMLTAAGVVYLPKPYDIGKLADVVRACLDQRDSKPQF